MFELNYHDPLYSGKLHMPTDPFILSGNAAGEGDREEHGADDRQQRPPEEGRRAPQRQRGVPDPQVDSGNFISGGCSFWETY